MMSVFRKALKEYCKDVWHDFCLSQLYNKEDCAWELFEQKRGNFKTYLTYHKKYNPKQKVEK